MDTRTRQLLDLYTDYLLASFGQVTATGLATLLPQQVSHDQVTRFLASSQFTNADLWKVVKPHVRRIQSEEGVLVLDDTVEEKPYTDQSELINRHFDRVTNRTVKGVNLLSALYVTAEAFLPVDFALIHKTQLVTDPRTGKDKWQSETTEHAMARQMIDACIRKQVPFRYVLADVFYASAETMVFIKHKKRREFVLPLKNNRKVALSEADKRRGQWMPVSSLTLDSNAPSPVIYLESVPFALRVHRQVFQNKDGSEGVLYLVSSDLALSGPEMAALYQKRWEVEGRGVPQVAQEPCRPRQIPDQDGSDAEQPFLRQPGRFHQAGSVPLDNDAEPFCVTGQTLPGGSCQCLWAVAEL
jgi:hypothetical protein